MSSPSGTSPTLIVGLGNPGRQYKDTRHNVGFMVLDLLAEKLGLQFSKEKKWEIEVARKQRPGDSESIWFVKPQTFMNLSGHAVAGMARFYQIPAEEILVIYDDVDLPLGTLRFRTSGSAGGHNGIKSIISCLGCDSFSRLKLGISDPDGRPQGGNMSNHVLGRFSPEEKEKLTQMMEEAETAVETTLESGIAEAMNRFNRRPRKPKPAVRESGSDPDQEGSGEETSEKRGTQSSPLQNPSEGAINTDPKNTE